ncbi:hypothetical protein IPdc08_01874 [archaeon]|nr:hypothetical protein IPdc08_01874 [archaeon]
MLKVNTTGMITLPLRLLKLWVRIMKFRVAIDEDKEVGGYVVNAPALLGCHSQGGTIDEALENIKEAIQACLESLSDDAVKEAILNPSS